MISYVYLGTDIVLELCGTTFIKASEGFTKLFPAVMTLVLYGLCYFFFAKALNSINLSIAYATWCGVGIIAATLISILIYKEAISFLGIIGIVLVVAGVIILNTVGMSH